jgi:hypothetical protein
MRKHNFARVVLRKRVSCVLVRCVCVCVCVSADEGAPAVVR